MRSEKPLVVVSFLVLAFLYSASGIAQGKIYKWTDEDGKVHYGERSDSTDVEAIAVGDKYAIPSADSLEALNYPNEIPQRLLAFASVQLTIPGADTEMVRIGRIACGKAVDIYWDKGEVDLLNPQVVEESIEVFKRHNYQVENAIGRDAMGSLLLVANINKIKMKACPSSSNRKLSQNATYLRVKWTIKDSISGRQVLEVETEGSNDDYSLPAIPQGSFLSLRKALSNAAQNLLAHKNLIGSLHLDEASLIANKFDDKLPLKLRYGAGLGNFSNESNEIKENTVIVKTTNGHGSGVLINREGYLLTNAHVIGDETTFSILIDKETFKGRLIRKEVFRDVALVKIEASENLPQGVDVARKLPNTGAEIYVIGTPLALNHSHSITKGIVSAYRNMQGLPFIQTDASINRGNSGGPVFNAQGELIALTVSGMFTKDGANIGINYLIPIDDAFKYLAVDGVLTDNKILSQLDNEGIVYRYLSSSDESNVKRYLLALFNWLNSPVI